MTPNKLLLFILTVSFCSGCARKKQLERTSILNTPTIGSYTLNDPEYKFSMKLLDGYPDEKSAWIVYSDRDNNTTYQNPGNEKQPLASLNFMQACFVIGEKEDYVELAEYIPRVNVSKGKKALENPKYLGWIPKSTALLWNRAIKDKETNYYVKTITAFGTQRIFEILQNHISGDSIITFANPLLNQPVAKCGMEQIFYIYKESALGNEYLIGPDPNFLPENSMQAGMGWVSKDLIRVWGTKGFIAVHPDLEASLPFYRNYPAVKNNVVDQEPVTTVKAPYTTPKSDLEKMYPILKYNTTKEGDVLISSSFLEDALDKDKNRVYNISGNLISNEAIENFSNKSSKLNIILVVSSGRKNGQYINNLQGVLETNAWQEAARNNFRQLSIGAVVYKDYGPNCDNAITPLTDDYRIVDEFLQEQRKTEQDGCDDNSYYQGVYGGIVKATKMLQEHRNESNIILVYGSGSDDTKRKGEAISGISSVNARLLFFQTHNIPNEQAYIRFVGDAQELISKSAENIIDLKKEIIVPGTYPNIPNSIGFISDSTGRVQQLDYPGKAISQGVLLFPHDSENMPAKYLADYLDSLITTIAEDNRAVERGLRSAIAQSSSGNTRIKNQFAYRFPKYNTDKIPLAFLKSNTLRNQNFLIPAWIVLKGNDSSNGSNGLSAGVLLSEKEYPDFANQLALFGSGSHANTKEMVVKYVLDAVEKAQVQQNIKIDKPLKELTFSEALGYVSGYYPVDPVWRSTTLSEYRSSEKINVSIGTVFLEECKSKSVWLRDHNNNANLQIRNNGRKYYVLDETHLPVNTAIGNTAPKQNDMASSPATANNTKEQNKIKDRAEAAGPVITEVKNPGQEQIPVPGEAKTKIAGAKERLSKKKDQDKAPEAGSDTPANAGNNDHKNGKKEEQRKNKVDLDEDLKPTESTASKKEKKQSGTEERDSTNYRNQIATKTEKPTEKGKKAAPKSNADLDKDLTEVQGTSGQNNADRTETKQPKGSKKAKIKKKNDENISLEEDLDQVQDKDKNKKENKPAADTVNYRNQISKQKN